MIHGALHLRVGDGHIFRALNRRTVRRHSHIGPRRLGWDSIPAVGSITGQIPGHSPANSFPDTGRTCKSQLDATAKNIFANPYLFDEGPTLSSPTFLFEALLGAGAALLGVIPGIA